MWIVFLYFSVITHVGYLGKQIPIQGCKWVNLWIGRQSPKELGKPWLTVREKRAWETKASLQKKGIYHLSVPNQKWNVPVKHPKPISTKGQMEAAMDILDKVALKLPVVSPGWFLGSCVSWQELVWWGCQGPISGRTWGNECATEQFPFYSATCVRKPEYQVCRWLPD